MNKLKGIRLLSADGGSALIDLITMGEDNTIEAHIRSLREKLKDKEHKVRGAECRADLG
ncbi:hypothetical protein [Bacillus siamensis]|uniref:hypothetical protein n=1 Tax=Bacillus siamensis TaxID=659243 RepID=UPI0002FA5D48|nr:hypothetical protein [Bacillus siamensis]MED0770524.1 hypothetical protein [Bacillus siamensis]MED0774985.1 hypothetical protein [Bacillus siamensis]MED0779919.1 hypothetical protein [Bacillus siamensis]MED0834505.1 hypothetical protein [Bacillus siamensis]